MLKPEQAIDYLIDRGLLATAMLVRGDVVVSDDSRRNRSLRVGSTASPSYFLKQADPSNRSTRHTVRVEGQFYDRFAKGGHESDLKNVLPRFYGYDASHDLLVLELIPEAQTLTWLMANGAARVRRQAVILLANAIARCHRERPWDGAPAGLPFAFGFVLPGPELLRSVTRGQLEVVRIVQREPELLSRIEQIREGYRYESVIHGDLRSENVLVELDDAEATVDRVRLVDWELAAHGDPAWDVGCVFEQHLSRCLTKIEVQGQRSVELIGLAFADVLRAASDEMAVFWQTYRADASINEATAAQYCGLRLFQSAFERSRGATVPPLAAFMLQLGINMMQRPEDAAELVLGLPR